MWEKYTVCCPRDSPHLAYSYSPISVILLHYNHKTLETPNFHEMLYSTYGTNISDIGVSVHNIGNTFCFAYHLHI